MKQIYIFDCEVTAYDWLFVFKNISTGEYTIIHNDNEKLMHFVREVKPLLGGFNNKHYDNFIQQGIMLDYPPEIIKEINDLIITDGFNGYDIPYLRDAEWVDTFDLMDDTQEGQSLKSIEGHLGLDIVESSVSFDINRPWTDEELEEMIFYCKKDVDATERLYYVRKSYLETKARLAESKGYPPEKGMYWTNAKCTSVYLGAKKPSKMWTDERAYHYPDKLKREYIPQEVFDFFDKLQDINISRDEVFHMELKITVGGCPCTIAYGGIHGAIPHYVEQEAGSRVIRNKDVASYYPHLMVLPLDYDKKYGFCSRAIADPEDFKKALADRLQAKRSGNKAKNNDLKLVLNTTYGCMGNGQYKDGKYIAYNDLYDPLMCRSVCITGQLFLLELSTHLVQECPSLKIIQLNTDGIMVSLDLEDEPRYQEICDEWQKRTGFELEEDFIHKIIQRDVNNYCEIACDGGVKIKGGELVRGESKAGAWKVNNNMNIVAQAMVDYFVKGTDPAETINKCDRLFDFQIIAKAGGNYSSTYQVMNEVDFDGYYWKLAKVKGSYTVPVQRVNRVYAVKSNAYGTLYKIHRDTQSHQKIASLPEHCLIDNGNTATIDQIDKDWYIDLARDKIEKFLGTKKRKPSKRTLNKSIKKCIALL